MEAAVQYMVPVTVFVDTETKEVVRVLQENENMFLPDIPEVWDESWQPIEDEILAEEIADIAESATWPVWDRA
jgi:long-subunit acyl-CoA synthetase (AMP-forming)